MDASSNAQLSPFGQKLRKERELRHLSQEKLAEKVGCDVRSVRRWEQGKGVPDYENRHRLCQALDIDVEMLNQFFLAEEISSQVTQESILDDSYPMIDSMQDNRRLSKLRQRRRLLTLGAIGLGLVGIGIGATGVFYEASYARSSLLYTYHTPSGWGVLDVAWSPQGTYLAIVNAARVAQTIVILSESYTPEIQRSALNCLAWSPEGSKIAAPTADGTIDIWDPINAITLFHFSAVPLSAALPESIAWSHDGKRIAVSSTDGTVRIWNTTTGHLLLTYRGHKEAVWWIDWSPDDTHLASAGADASIRIWETTTGATALTYTGHHGAVMDVEWSTNGRQIVSASEDATVQIWDSRTGKTLFIYRGHSASVQVAEWSPDNKTIASAGVDKTIQLWNVQTGKRGVTYKGHTNTIWTLAWSPDGERLASASQDGTLRVWKVNL
jgi:WD40 repeat protein/DNA-binding XRE family transcriptional regulator